MIKEVVKNGPVIGQTEEDGIIAERPYFYIKHILGLRSFTFYEMIKIKKEFLKSEQLEGFKHQLNKLSSGTKLTATCFPDDYYWSVEAIDKKGKPRRFHIGQSYTTANVIPIHSTTPDFSDLLLARLAKEKWPFRTKFPPKDEYQVSKKYFGRKLAIITAHLKDHFQRYKNYYELFNLFPNLNFDNDLLIKYVLSNNDWKNNNEMDALKQVITALLSQSVQIVVAHQTALLELAQEKQIEIDFQLSEDSKTQKFPGWQQAYDYEIYRKTNKKFN